MSLNDFLKNKKSFKGFKKESDPNIIGLDFDIMQQEHSEGVQIADVCHVKEMSENFGWMRGHQNCWTGFPNDGKTQFTLYMMTLKALKAGWKFLVWSPEMKQANYVDGKIKVHYNILAYDIMSTISGKTPYKHIHDKYKVPFMSLDEVKIQKEFIDNHFIFLNPEKRDINSMYELIKSIYERFGFDAILIDPFKNIEPETNKRDDQHLHDVFARFKDLAIETNTVMNWIAHPKSNVNRVVNGDLVPCNQYMLSGGAAWDNSMDGIFSIQRPDTLTDISSPYVIFHNIKQKMQDLVAQRGSVGNIRFDIKTKRYLFNDVDPLEKLPKNEKLPETGKELYAFENKDFDSLVDEAYKDDKPPF